MPGFGGHPPSPNSALPPLQTARGRTSIRFGENQLSPGSVSFSLLPPGHPRTFHCPPVRASSGFYPAFTLPRGSSPGFGSTARDSRPVRTRFRCGYASLGLTSPLTATRGLINQKAHGHPLLGLPLLVGARFQVLFHSPSGVLFTFPSRYLCAIGRRVVFSLGGWSPRIPTGFHVSRGTRDHGPGSPLPFAYGAVTLYGPASQPVRLERGFVTPWGVRGLPRPCPATPTRQRPRAFAPRRFRLLPVRSPLLGESRLISFPPGTEMFHFPGYRTAFRRRVASRLPRFPHSGIPGSTPACGSPGLIAACHALHRLPPPRHPPCALSTFTSYSPLCSFQ